MRGRVVWAAFALCAGLVVAAIAWVSREALEREESQRTAERSQRVAEASQRAAEAELRRGESIRVALWRLDSALAPIVAATAFGPVQVRRADTEQVVEDWFAEESVSARIRAFSHHKFSPFGVIVTTRELPRASDRAAVEVLESLDKSMIFAHVSRFEPAVNEAQIRVQSGALTNGLGPGGDWVSNGTGGNFGDRAQRMRAVQSANRQSLQQDEAQTIADRRVGRYSGPLIPLWAGPEAVRQLLFLQREELPEFPAMAGVSGFALDWNLLRARLLAEISDLLPGAQLRPAPEGTVADEFADLVLATAPIALVAPPAPMHVPAAPATATAGFTATRAGLAVAWAAVFAALAAAAITLRASLADSERRARFASSVTHELRTPLTTFRLYSEMLADGMVTDPAQRQVYLDTLKSESARLATLVENVLAYARVEEGRAPRQRERIAVGALLERLLPPLRRRAEEARMELVADLGDAADAVLDVHADAVGQVLSNLVDNACKYAASATERRVEISVTRRDGGVAFRVRDHGPGIAPENVAAAFTPFERGNRPPGDGVPGIGLGLALSRGLARDQGGDLAVEPCDGGACLVLTL